MRERERERKIKQKPWWHPFNTGIEVLCLVIKTIDSSLYNDIIYRDNYTLPTCGLPLIWLAYQWFQFWHFTHLWFPPLVICNPRPSRRYSNTFFLKNKTQNKSNTSLSPKTHSHSCVQIFSILSLLQITVLTPNHDLLQILLCLTNYCA